MRILPATANDIPALVNLINSAYRGEGSKKGWTTEADLLGGIRTDEKSLSDMMNKPAAVILVCRSEANVITGCVYLQKQDNKLYLGMLTVSPELQAAGIGRQLLAAAEAHAKNTACSAITMTVISVRHELVAWYERHGYHKTGETKPFPTDPAFGIPKQPLEFVVMDKII
jgi:ribosomal protein S18 acetylase RimI-like enzyme